MLSTQYPAKEAVLLMAQRQHIYPGWDPSLQNCQQAKQFDHFIDSLMKNYELSNVELSYTGVRQLFHWVVTCGKESALNDKNCSKNRISFIDDYLFSSNNSKEKLDMEEYLCDQPMIDELAFAFIDWTAEVKDHLKERRINLFFELAESLKVTWRAARQSFMPYQAP